MKLNSNVSLTAIKPQQKGVRAVDSLQRNGDFLWFPQGADKALRRLETYTPITGKQLKQQVFLINRQLRSEVPEYFDFSDGLECLEGAMPNRWSDPWLAAVHITRSAVKRYLNLGAFLNLESPREFQLSQHAMLDDEAAPVNSPKYLNNALFLINDVVLPLNHRNSTEPSVLIEHVYKPQLPAGKTSHLISSPLMFPPDGASNPKERYAPTKTLNTVVRSTLQQWGFIEGKGADFMFKPRNPFFDTP
jgi:hypothetical protein